MDKKKKGVNKLVWLAFPAVVLLWIAAWVELPYLIPETNATVSAVRGQFGDMFGVVNALFSGLAFAAVVVTLYYQREDLKVQQDLLEQTIDEQKKSSGALAKQVETMKNTAELNALVAGINACKEAHELRGEVSISLGEPANVIRAKLIVELLHKIKEVQEKEKNTQN